MKEVFTTTQYRRDFKRYKGDVKKLKALEHIVDMLRRGEPLPPNARRHLLHGEYEGCLECHVGGGFLLVWVEDDNILLVRLGTHHELFGL